MVEEGNLVWKIQLAVSVKHPVLNRHLDLISTAWESLGLLSGVPKEIETGQAGVHIETRYSKRVIMKPKGPGLLRIRIQIDCFAGTGVPRRDVTRSGSAVGSEPGIRPSIKVSSYLGAVQ